MRTTRALDHNTLAEAQAYTSLEEKTALVRESLKPLIECEVRPPSAHPGGTEPMLKPIPQRRSTPK